MIAAPIVLYFADGSTREICGSADSVLGLIRAACRGQDLTPWQSEQLNLIRRSVYALEPGGAHMVELLQCLLHGQAEEQSSVAPVRC